MPSPFPAMDPYLEGYLWPDVHHSLAGEIRAQLAAKIWPNYVARITVRFVAEEAETQESVGVMLPDVELLRRHSLTTEEPRAQVAVTDITAAPLVLSLPPTIRVRLASIEIHDRAHRDLVTSIEILSPVNKRGTGWDEYERKRQSVMQSSAHLLEIDLLRRGRRHVDDSKLPPAPYFVFLTRAPLRQIEVWPIQLHDRFPILPVPLFAPDPDVPLDLNAVLATIYDEARYDGDIDYRQPPDPPLEGEDAQWAAALTQNLFPSGG